MRIIYFVTSHKNPNQVLRLIKKIRELSADSFILIHHDYSCSDFNISRLRNVKNIYVMKKYTSVEWGGSNRVQMHLNGLRWLSKNIHFDWVIIISGQDYPIQPLIKLENVLARTKFDAFVEGVLIQKTILSYRYYYQYFQYPKILINSLIEKYIEKYFGRGKIYQKKLIILPAYRRIGLASKKNIFNEKFQCYKGIDWFTLSKKAVDCILKFTADHRAINRYYARTLHASESYFQSILHNAKNLNVADDSLRYMRWPTSGPTSHPSTLTLADHAEIMASGKYFARKFDQSIDQAILDKIDIELGRSLV